MLCAAGVVGVTSGSSSYLHSHLPREHEASLSVDRVPCCGPSGCTSERRSSPLRWRRAPSQLTTRSVDQAKMQKMTQQGRSGSPS
eukprot:scaffold2739_cov257-Pinguiococcus_pyrenoidosus.AAC.11